MHQPTKPGKPAARSGQRIADPLGCLSATAGRSIVANGARRSKTTMRLGDCGGESALPRFVLVLLAFPRTSLGGFVLLTEGHGGPEGPALSARVTAIVCCGWWCQSWTWGWRWSCYGV